MFDGQMPNTNAPRRPSALDIASGVQPVPNGYTPSANPAGGRVGICEWHWEQALPRVVQLAFPAQGVGPAKVFPPSITGSFRQCGLVSFGGAPIDTSTPWLAAVIEYGCGAAAQVMYCDWIAGAINLPPSDFVKVSALPWGVAWGALVVQCQASVSTGSLQGSHVPTATGTGQFAAGVPQTFVAPQGARALGIENGDSAATLPVVNVTGGARAKFDFAAGAFLPGTQVVDVFGNALVTVTSDIDCILAVRWYMQP